jgi:hypothetical protein
MVETAFFHANFRTFSQMLVAHLGNVWYCEFSLQTSGSVKCDKSLNFDAKLRAGRNLSKFYACPCVAPSTLIQAT